MHSSVIKISLIYFLMSVFCSCNGQKGFDSQKHISFSSIIENNTDFCIALQIKQNELFKHSLGFSNAFYNKHLKMNMPDNLSINQNDTVYIMERISIPDFQCVSYSWNSRKAFGLDCRDYPNNLYNLSYIRPLIERWDKQEIEQNGKKKYISLDNYGDWYVSRIIIRPDTMILDGVAIETLPAEE